MVSAAELAAIEHALSRSGIGLESTGASRVTLWRRAAAREAVTPPASMIDAGYARSPRSTRGATRA